jgi:hypothetical protein
MHGSRPRVSPGQRRSWWARQVARQQSTNVPVVRFCQQLCVPTSTVYDWKRRCVRVRETSSQPTLITPSSPNPTGREDSLGFAPQALRCRPPLAGFVTGPPAGSVWQENTESSTDGGTGGGNWTQTDAAGTG